MASSGSDHFLWNVRPIPLQARIFEFPSARTIGFPIPFTNSFYLFHPSGSMRKRLLPFSINRAQLGDPWVKETQLLGGVNSNCAELYDYNRRHIWVGYRVEARNSLRHHQGFALCFDGSWRELSHRKRVVLLLKDNSPDEMYASIDTTEKEFFGV